MVAPPELEVSANLAKARSEGSEDYDLAVK